MKKTRTRVKKLKTPIRASIIAASFGCLVFLGVTYLLTYSEFTSKFEQITPGDSLTGIVGSTVIIDNLESDYYYYTAQNYTYNEGFLPTRVDKQIYTDNNLVQMQVTYNGQDLRTNDVGYVSLNELQNNYIYYKTLPVDDNGTTDTSDDFVLIDLIDNPFTDRPVDKGFNGWITNYVGALVTYDYDYYTRQAKVPVTYTDGTPDKIEITFNANWIEAKVSMLGNNWANAFAELDTAGMHEIETTIDIYDTPSVVGYYKSETITTITTRTGGGWNPTYTTEYGTCTDCYTSTHQYYEEYTCPAPTTNRWGTTFTNSCTIYYLQDENDTFDFEAVYYQWSNNRYNVVTLTPTYIETVVNPEYTGGVNMAGFFASVTIPRYSSYAGYYNSSGEYQESGTCNTAAGCTYYELIQYYDSDGNPSIMDESINYYYLATRDTNIIVMNNGVTNTWETAQNKPFTLTGAYNDRDYNPEWTVSNIYVHCYNDTVIENITINAGTGNANTEPNVSNNTTRTFYGNYHNVKLGRGIKRSGTNRNFIGILGGNNTAVPQAEMARYTFMVESGFYNGTSLTTGSQNSSARTVYVEGRGIYGNDYDLANNDNTLLDVYYCASGSWSSAIRASSLTSVALHTTVKSGSFGTGRAGNTTGIYIGGRAGGTYYAARSAKIEGGWIYNLIGGPLTANNRSTYNDTYIYMTGGEVDMITSGAGTTATYGNRIAQITGGKVNYSVFGGSNGYNAGSGSGTVNGSSYIYIGGNAVIGDTELVNNNSTLWGAEAGSVFGIGNGNSSYNTIGSNDNSTIIINDNAQINRNVYGGGNYSSVGVSSNLSTTTTDIIIHDGLIYGSVFGGGNNNGAGDTNTSSTVTIEMTGGTIVGSLYGGSNQRGTIYGSANLNIYGGTIEGSIYGGGLGGYTNNNNTGTFIQQNVKIVVGAEGSTVGPTILTNIYGGSSFGTVNNTSNTTAGTNYSTNVTVNYATINGSVFGGGQGNATYTPNVNGDVFVTVNNGNIGNVYGGNDQAGMPSKDVLVTINNGTVGNVFGGGNQTSLTTSNVIINNGTITNAFGGSNNAGTVTTSNITMNNGKVTKLYGGNNVGGNTVTSNVIANGGTISEVYGGGRLAATSVTNVNLNGAITTDVYGGGESADVTTSTLVEINSGSANKVYGGSNVIGTVPVSTINAYGGGVEDIFGGNNAGGTTVTTNVLIDGVVLNNIFGGGNEAESTTSNVYVRDIVGNISNVYGGGNLASVTTTNVRIEDGTIGSVFGGSNQAGNVNESNVVINNVSNNLVIGYVYGGNNLGGMTNTANVTIDSGSIDYVFGGGNRAETEVTTVIMNGGTINAEVYGGGNLALVDTNTDVDILGGTINSNVFGGGNSGEVLGSTDLYVSGATVNGSVYAGGNGSTAIVYGNTLLNIDNSTTVGTHVFGGGNAAVTGDVTIDNAESIVNIAGAHILGNVYGGANTSVVYGTTHLNIGYNTVTNTSLIKSDVMIEGTVFGGGEANASGSDIYDFSFISVTKGINIDIDGATHNNFYIRGSIFGSGNASSTTGASYININNYGTFTNYQRNVSIQRTDVLTISNSAIELSGATDRTNEYSDVLFSFSRIKELKLKNNSTLFLQTGANLLQKYSSLVDVNGTEVLATADINDETKTVTKNVDNRIYMLEGKNLNIATNENVTAYGEVKGMTFFGMYNEDRDGLASTAFYSPNYSYGDTVNENLLYYFTSGSYVLGLHNTNQDITKDGFYSNFANEDNLEILNTQYINPIPEDSNYYMWVIGEQIASYEINLTASKYVTLGTNELSLLNNYNANSTFSIVGFNDDNLNSEVSLIDQYAVPRVADTPEEADNIMALVLENGSGWITHGTTSFLTDNANPIVGTKDYLRENTNAVPSFVMYLIHSKNLETSGEMGSVIISLLVTTPIDDLNNDVERINLIVNLSRALYTTNDYEATITTGKRYEMFATSTVNITNKGSFSTYYSLYLPSDETPYLEGYHRALVSSYVFPENTKITMIDFASRDVPVYYYYVVSAEDVAAATVEYNQYGETSYNFSKFVRMGSSDQANAYDDDEANAIYYDETLKSANEEFIFIVDFGETDIPTDQLNNSLLVELRNNNNRTIINVLGASQNSMFYSVYSGKDAIIDVVGTIDSAYVYPGSVVNLDVTTHFVQQTNSTSEAITDTTFNDQKLGVKISILDANGNQVSGASILGVTFTHNGITYYPRIDGTTRINISPRVANVSSRIKINTTDSLASGNYQLLIETFGSPDGIYYGLTSSDTATIDFTVLNTVYGLEAVMSDNNVVIDAKTGFNQAGSNVFVFTIRYSSNLTNPILRVHLSRRNYDSVYSLEYNSVDLKDFISDNYIHVRTDTQYVLLDPPGNSNNIFWHFKDNLQTGTYRLEFSLYDDSTFIGEIYKYIIIK